MKNVLKVENVTMQFGGVVAVDNLNMEVNQGEIVALIGPNGAGKTTAFNVITGVYAPTNGRVCFNEKCIVRNHPTGKMKKTYKGEYPTMYTAQFAPEQPAQDETAETQAARQTMTDEELRAWKAEQKEISNQITEADKTLKSLESEIEKALAEYEAAEAAEQAAAASIANMIAQYNAQKAAEEAQAKSDAENAASRVEEMNRANQEAEANGQEPPYSQDEINQAQNNANTGGASGGDSGFMWPVPCSTRVTSRYGNRADPFTGQTRYHSGIDIDGFGNDGAPIVAAASGVVVTASSDSGYGNYVIINHGDTSTVYAHMSGFAVSTGDYVSQGQTVGYLGATGRATGTHLHFEVYVGDGRVDPAAYFSGITYYNC